jgi:hypothetical protein
MSAITFNASSWPALFWYGGDFDLESPAPLDSTETVEGLFAT